MEKTQQNASAARSGAIDGLLRIWRGEAIIDDLNVEKLTSQERAYMRRLIVQSLRHHDGIEDVIAQYSPKRPMPRLRATLHLIAVEILLENEQAYGVLDSYVHITKAHPKTFRYKGYVNAVGRKIALHDTKLIGNNAMGEKMRAYLPASVSEENIQKINLLSSQAPPLDIRLKSHHNAKDWAERLGAVVLDNSQTIRFLPQKNPQGKRILPRVQELEGFAEGDWWVQDYAASLAVEQFENLKGARVLDICAAPGGKTMQLADYGARVDAVEISPLRAERIAENLSRTNLQAEIFIEDALKFSHKPYDKILLDAPCSASGTLRRHPDLRFQDFEARLKALLPLQSKLLHHSADLLRANGELIYVTCSLFAAEGEAQITQFCAERTDMKIVPLRDFEGKAQDYLRIWPYDCEFHGGCDGFFIAKMVKT